MLLQNPETVFCYDEIQDVDVSLDLLIDQLEKVSKTPQHWKWVIIALYSSLQAFMVLALGGRTNPMGIIKKKHQGPLQEFYDSLPTGDKYLERFDDSLPNGEKYPEKVELDSLSWLYQRLKKSDYMGCFEDCQAFVPSSTQDENITRLEGLRHDFVHFQPKRWVIEKQFLVSTCLDCLPIIDFVLEESCLISWQTSVGVDMKNTFFQKTMRVNELLVSLSAETINDSI